MLWGAIPFTWSWGPWRDWINWLPSIFQGDAS